MTSSAQRNSNRRVPVVLGAVAISSACLLWIFPDSGGTTDPRTDSSEPPALILTQHVTGGPLIVASQAPGGSHIVITQSSLPTFEIQPPLRHYIGGRRVSEDEVFQTPRFHDTLGLSLIDNFNETADPPD